MPEFPRRTLARAGRRVARLTFTGELLISDWEACMTIRAKGKRFMPTVMRASAFAGGLLLTAACWGAPPPAVLDYRVSGTTTGERRTC